MNTVDAAQGKWYGILKHFGLGDEFLRNKHGACPLCGGRDRYRWDDKDGSGSYYCSQCGAGDGMKLAIEWTGKAFKDVAKEIDAIIGNIQQSKPKDSKPDPRIRLNEVAKKRAAIDSINPVRAYLKSRGLKPVAGIEYCESVRYWQDSTAYEYPAMVCLVRGSDNAPLTWHVTHLTQQGEKAPVDSVRKILPPMRPLSGSAIRLGGVAETIGIAEGVESALAVTQIYGMTCWAAMNTTLLEQFVPPEGVHTVAVFGDNDTNFAGQKAAYALANRLHRTMDVEVHLPAQPGTDFADELLQIQRQKSN